MPGAHDLSDAAGVDAAFWALADRLLAASRIVIDRPRGTPHPRYPALIYPLDYGYLEQTQAMDGGGIDVWLGTTNSGRIEALVCTLDLLKRDAEVKLLIGCSEHEQQIVLRFVNDSELQRGLLISRSAG